jgi:hypothetical protein
MPRETLACLLELSVSKRFILGNGDREVRAQLERTGTDWYRTAPEHWRAPVSWSAQELRGEHPELLASWPATCQLEIPGLGAVLFCHATPRSDTEVFTRLTAEDCLLPIFAQLDVDLVVCGHTHMQFDRTIGRTRVVNAGSVGMPFGEPGAYWLLLGPGVELRRTLYDFSQAADRIRRTRYPQADEFAARHVLQPPTEAKTLEGLARVELR